MHIHIILNSQPLHFLRCPRNMGNSGHVKPLNKTHAINKIVLENAKMLYMKIEQPFSLLIKKNMPIIGCQVCHVSQIKQTWIWLLTHLLNCFTLGHYLILCCSLFICKIGILMPPCRVPAKRSSEITYLTSIETW